MSFMLCRFDSLPGTNSSQISRSQTFDIKRDCLLYFRHGLYQLIYVCVCFGLTNDNKNLFSLYVDNGLSYFPKFDTKQQEPFVENWMKSKLNPPVSEGYDVIDKFFSLCSYAILK